MSPPKETPVSTLRDLYGFVVEYATPDFNRTSRANQLRRCEALNGGIKARLQQRSTLTLTLALTVALTPNQFNSIRHAPPQRGENAHRDARLAREMSGLTSMAWDDKYAR